MAMSPHHDVALYSFIAYKYSWINRKCTRTRKDLITQTTFSKKYIYNQLKDFPDLA